MGSLAVRLHFHLGHGWSCAKCQLYQGSVQSGRTFAPEPSMEVSWPLLRIYRELSSLLLIHIWLKKFTPHLRCGWILFLQRSWSCYLPGAPNGEAAQSWQNWHHSSRAWYQHLGPGLSLTLWHKGQRRGPYGSIPAHLPLPEIHKSCHL